MAEFKVNCPKCGENIQCDEDWRGFEINCMACGCTLVIPQAGQIVKEAHVAKHSTPVKAEIKMFCPHCGQHIQCDASHRGKQINCPTCNQMFLVLTAQNQAAASIAPPQARRTAATQSPAPVNTSAMLQECPKCSSPDIQRASMGYMAGVSQVSGAGVGVTIDGDVGVGSYGGTQRTLLSQYLSPPEKRWVVLVVIIIYCLASIAFAVYSCIKNDASFAGILAAPLFIPFIARALFVNALDQQDLLVFILLVVAPTVAAFFFAKKNKTWNKTIYPQLMQKYNRTWYCRRCGHAWFV